MSNPDRTLRILAIDEIVHAVAWSPDGTRLAVAGEEGVVEVWMADGRRLWSRREHTGNVWAVSWSPDGARLASGAGDTTLRLWDPSNGEALAEFALDDEVYWVEWAPEGGRLACSYPSPHLDVLDTRSGRRLLRCVGHKSFIETLAWSPVASRLASGSGDTTIRIWDSTDGSCLRVLEGHENAVRSVHWSRDGRRLVSSASDATVQIWDAVSGEPGLTLEGHTSIWISAAWCPEAEMVASGSQDETVRLWSLQTGKELARLEQHTNGIWHVAFSPDGGRLASASDDKTVRIWDVSDLCAAHAVQRAPETPNAYIGRHATTVGRRAVHGSGPAFVPRLANAEGMCLGVLNGTATQWAGSVTLSTDGTTLITGHPNGVLRCWDLATGRARWTSVEKHQGIVHDVALSPEGRLVGSGGSDGLRLWDAATGRSINVLVREVGAVWRVSWSSDGARVASASSDGTVRVWDVRTGASLWVGTGHTEAVRGVSWSPDGRWLASGSDDHQIRIWDAAGGQSRHAWPAHSDNVVDVRYSPDGRYLASTSFDRTVRVWEVASWREHRRCEGHSGQVESVAWSSDSRYLVSAGYEDDGTVRIWDAVTGRELARHAAPESYVWRVVWSADGSFLASSHFGDVFRLWDTRAFTSAGAGRQVAVAGGGLPHELAYLPSALASLHRMGLHPPLSLAHELLQLTGGRTANSILASHPGIRSLIDLRWPLPARVGLAALLLSRVPLQGWEPSDDLAPARLREDLTLALSGESCEPEAPPIPVAALQQAADRIDERTLTLLQVLGPEAVATEPGLVLRLGARVGLLPALTAPRRRLLGMRLSRRGGTGAGQGVAGAGAERVGIERRGDPRFLLPWQLELPQEVFASRYQRGELLYRAGVGDDPPRLRPAVLVLDVSPPSYGPVEATTRLAAHVMGSSLLEAGLGVVLVTVGGPGEVRILEREADLVDVWTLRSLEPASAVRGLRRAAGMREAVKDGQGEPVIVVLSHAYFGLEEDLPAELPGLRGLFVQYPGQRVRPALSALCERWETVGPGETGGLSAALGRLLG